ncbi:MAG TPA: DivIVA domain-containing protein [Acidimicrobiales bacterium]|nr:DivIVA domain-containing protein [Acidimicrobiales bacterium]
MAEGLHPLGSSPVVAADEVRRRSFATSFRGYDQGQVRAFLEQVADELRDFGAQQEELRRQLREARERTAHPRLDEQSLTAALGEEAGRILQSAHDAANDIRRRAEENAAAVLREAHGDAERLRAEAQTVLGERTLEAETAAERIRAAAAGEAAAITARATEASDAVLAQATAQRDAAVQEAEGLRARILGDLMRRRRVVHSQVEQLGAGRDALMGMLGEMRRLIDDMAHSLERAEAEAKLAADAAVRRALAEPEPTVEEMQAEARSLPGPPPGIAPVVPPGPAASDALSAQPASDAPPAPPAEPAAGAESASPSPEPFAPGPPPAPESRAGTERRLGTEPKPVAPERPPAAEPRGAPLAPVSSIPATGDEPVEEGTTEERRMSSLRILRRGGRQETSQQRHPSRQPAVPEDGFEEGVSIIRPIRPAATEPAPDEPAATATEPPGVAAASPDPQPAPSEAFTSRPAAESDPAAPEPEAGSPAAGGAEPLGTASRSEAPPATPGDGEERSNESVEQLFARIRAEREEALRSAHQVLADRAGTESAAGHPSPDSGPPADEVAAAGPASSVAAGHEEVPGDQGGEAAPAAEGAVGEDKLLARRNDLLAPMQDRLARKLKRTMQDDQNDLLDQLRRRPDRPLPELIGQPEDHIRRYVEATELIFAEAFSAGAGFLSEDAPPAGAAPAGGHGPARDLAAAVVEPLRNRLADVHSGSDSAEPAAEAVGAAYRAWKGERIESLAMDHLVSAFGRGLLASVEAGAPMTWVVDDDGGPCPDCEDNQLAGPTPAGQGYPTGHAHPPAHPGCRCLVAPAPA